MTWRPVPGYRGLYEVNDKGGVRSLPRLITHYTGSKFWRKGKVLTHSYSHGYPQVTLSKNGQYKTAKIHDIVASAFIGPKPVGSVVRHMDGNKSNTRASNIRYGSNQDNSDDMGRHGTVLRGESHGMSKLTNAQVRRIKRLLPKRTNTELAKLFGVVNQQISNIRLGKAWRHL